VSVRQVVAIGDPVLRRPAGEVDPDEIGSPEFQALIDDLIDTKRATHGAGIAANQVGEVVRVAVIEVEKVRYLDRSGEERNDVKRGLTAGTFQHEVDHLDGVLFVDRADPRTFATWEQFDRYQRDEFVRRVTDLTEEIGS
jgi:peptide deformylase